MFCCKCGQKLYDGELFCTNCGCKNEKFSEIPEPMEKVVDSEPDYPMFEQTKVEKLSFVGIKIIILIVVVILTFYLSSFASNYKYVASVMQMSIEKTSGSTTLAEVVREKLKDSKWTYEKSDKQGHIVSVEGTGNFNRRDSIIRIEYRIADYYSSVEYKAVYLDGKRLNSEEAAEVMYWIFEKYI